MAITDSGACLDIKVRNFWRRGQDAFFDGLYFEPATFTLTPLVIGINGGVGDERDKFLKNLAKLLACEKYSDVMTYDESENNACLSCFPVQCVHGSRIPSNGHWS